MNNTVVFAGSFDPFTLGHYDIVSRAAKVYDSVVVFVSAESKTAMFDLSVRIEIVKRSVADLGNVQVKSFNGLLTDAMAKEGASVLVRGLRNASDFDYERNLCAVYKSLADIECVYLFASPGLNHVSSTFVRELIRLNGDLSGYVVASVLPLLRSP